MAYYFVSDVHAGLMLDGEPTRSGERFAAWLDAVAPDADEIFLLGDIFDFWFEYKNAVPPGYDDILDKLAALSARGIGLHFFPGNHDMWTLDYLSRRCGMTVHTGGYSTTLYDKNIYMEHGDIQSIGSRGERLMQCLFRSRGARRAARALVPAGTMMRFGNRWSRSNRSKHGVVHIFRKEEEGIVRFARAYLADHPVDYFVFGHLHAPTEYRLSEQATLYVLGDWIRREGAVYGRLDREGFLLKEFRSREE